MPCSRRVSPAPLAVLEIGAAAIDDDVTLLEMRQQAVDNQVDDLAGGGSSERPRVDGPGIGQINPGCEAGAAGYRPVSRRRMPSDRGPCGLYTVTRSPWSSMLRAILRPMTPRP